MVKSVVLTAFALLMSVTTSSAMDRYYCTVDDEQLKLSLETGFKEMSGWPLSHLRAIVIFKPRAGKTVTGTLMIGSSNIIQYWRDGQSMMLRTVSRSGAGADTTDVDVIVDSRSVNKDINHFVGHYTVLVRPLGKDDPSLSVTLNGPLTCDRF